MLKFRKILGTIIALAASLSLLVSVPAMAAVPSVGSVGISPDPAYADTPLTAVPVEWADADNDAEGYQWQWQKWDAATTSWLDIAAATSDTLDNANFAVGDQIKVICTPFDGTEAGVPVEASITISDGIVTISPDPAYADTDLTATPLHWVGPDSFTFQWQKWDIVSEAWLDIAGATSVTLDNASFAVGDQIKVICTPFTGAEPAAAVEAIITISSGIVVISPDPAFTDSTLSAAPAHWLAADSFNYQWQKWDIVTETWLDIAGATSDTLAESNFVKNDQVQVTCTAYIGSVIDDTATDAVTISNTIPSITGVSLTPNPADTSSDLAASPAGWTDADDDPEGYQWRWQIWDEVGAEWVDIAGETTDALDSANFGLNDQIKVICTPFDGTDSGASVEALSIISVLGYDAGVDVKPGSEENPINLKSNGVIPLVIYTTEGFDAAEVGVETLKFGPNEASPVHTALEDVDGDGDLDLVVHFRTQETGITEDDTEVTLTGTTISGTSFTGTVAIKIVPSKSQAPEQGEDPEDGQTENEGRAIGKESAPGQNKEPGERATGKGQNKE
jgi:hypothetical protein